MVLFDTHAHIHDPSYGYDNAVYDRAVTAGVQQVVCVGTDLDTSRQALDYAEAHKGVYASIGLHPHDGARYAEDTIGKKAFAALLDCKSRGDKGYEKLIAIGECGLDYYHDFSTPEAQRNILLFQLDLAKKHDLPLIFHVRDAFTDFWDIIDTFKGLRGTIHSFTADKKRMYEAINRGLYISLNGIMTFSKVVEQLEAAKEVPLERLLLETDAPYLTPKPKRGTINEPSLLWHTATFLAGLRQESIEELAEATTRNAHNLFLSCNT
jgi:TatD DNase family protein